MCPGKPVKLPLKAPSKGEYQKLAAAAATRSGKQLGKAAVKGLDGDLARSGDPAVVGSVLTVGALSRGSSGGALYIAARTAAKLPDDALAASNLSAMLVARGEVVDAEKAILRSIALAGDKPVNLSNRGWVHYRAGDVDGARALFTAALQKNADLALAERGLAMLAACRDEVDQAKQHWDRASKTPWPSPMNDLAREKQSKDDPGPPPSDPPAPDAPPELELPPPPISQAFERTPADADAAERSHKDLLDRRIKWQAEQLRFREKTQKLWDQGRYGGIEVNRYQARHEPYGTEMDDTAKKFRTVYQVLQKSWTDFTMSVAAQQRRQGEIAACGGDDPCVKGVRYRQCLEYKQRAETLHTNMWPVFQDHWPRAEAAIKKNWRQSWALIARFPDPEWIELHRIMLEGQVLIAYATFIDSAWVWNGQMKQVAQMTCKPPPPPASTEQKFAKAGQGPKGPCPVPTLELKFAKFAGVSLELQCFSLKLEIAAPGVGPRPMGYLKYDVLDNELTVFGGAKIGGDVPGGELEGRAGLFLSFTDDGPTGFGMEGELSASVAGGVGAEAELQLNVMAIGAGPPVEGEQAMEILKGDFAIKKEMEIP